MLLGQVVIRQSSIDITWAAVSGIAGSTITYEIVRAPIGDKAGLTILGETPTIEYTISFLGNEGGWVVGVRSVRTIDSNGERVLSAINWSDVNGVFTPIPFTILWYAPADVPEDLRLQ
ncbi:MAG TPA: hypothetical protein ENH82_17075 [bacterium]|nr:hypothetical protein [bacterium]